MHSKASEREKIAERRIDGRHIVACMSEAAEDFEWDSFLMETPLGQYQQSSFWGRAKATEGWTVARVVMLAEDHIVGGFQALYRSSWWGGIGYVSKGPVVEKASGALAGFSVELLEEICARLRLRALVVQPPDASDEEQFRLTDRGFMSYAAGTVIESTWLVDLCEGMANLERFMTQETRLKVRQARRREISVRQGGREDIPVFFDLMLSSCRRQGVHPNPHSVETLLRLWDACAPHGCIGLLLAEHRQIPISGILCIRFGKRVSAWKKGWSNTSGNLRPNDILLYEALKWALDEGYAQFDHSGFDDRLAVAISRGERIDENGMASRHYFHVRFGGRPVILPAAMIFIPNPLLRLAYKVVFRKKIRRALERRREMDAVRREALDRADASA